MKKLFFFLLLCMFLSGCLLGPHFHPPAAPPTDKYTYKPMPTKIVGTPGAGRAGKSQYVELGEDIPANWWALFHSRELDDLICAGIANSPNLRAAEAALRNAQQIYYAQYGSLLLPSVNAGFQATRQRFSPDTFGQSNLPPRIFSLFYAAVSVSYTLDLFGGLHREVEAYKALVDNQYFELEAAYLTLTANIITTAVTAASLQAQVKATQELIAAQDNTLRIVEQQFELGGASRTDILTQQTQLAQLRATLPPLEKSLAQTTHALAVLIGVLPSQFEMPNINLDRLNLPTNLPVTIPSELVRQRPDIRASEALLHQAMAKIGVATANFFPQITLTAFYGGQSNRLSNIFTHRDSVWNITGQILQPLFAGGSLIAQWRAANAAFAQSFEQYRQVVLQAFQNVADVLRALEFDAKALRAQQLAQSSALQTLNLTQGQFKLGGASYLNLLNAQRAYQEARINFIQAKAARYNDTVALFQSLGGGWWNRGPIVAKVPLHVLVTKPEVDPLPPPVVLVTGPLK